MLKTARWSVFFTGVLLTACGGGGGGGSSSSSEDKNEQTFNALVGGFGTPASPSTNATMASCQTIIGPPPGSTISGTVLFERVSLARVIGLDYSNIKSLPARGLIVEAVTAQGDDCSETIIDTTLTDGNGDYGLAVADSNQSVCVRVRAQMYREAGSGDAWNVQVGDNTRNNAPYYLIDTPATAAERSVRNLLAESGWGGSSYTAARASAPFALLDTACDAMTHVLAAAPPTILQPLFFRWSPSNTSADGDLSAGDVGGTFFRRRLVRGQAINEIFVLGDDDLDTDEFDAHVIAHEYGHFVTSQYFRTDSLGGNHNLSDFLDGPVGFEEGWANAFSAIAMTGVINQPEIYRDTLGLRQMSGFQFNMEQSAQGTRGWYSERSVFEIIYDLFDNNNETPDTLSYGFGPIFSALVGHSDTEAFTSVFSFINAMMQRNPADEAALNALVAGHNIEPVKDDFGSAETTNSELGSAQDVRPYLLPLVQNTPVTVCSNNQFGNENKLSVFQNIPFDAPGDGNYDVSLVPQSAVGFGAVDIYQQGQLVAFNEADEPGQSVSFSVNLQGGLRYVLSVAHIDNVLSESDAALPGRQCFGLQID